MRLLLDTHISLWWRSNNRRLPSDTRDAISDAEMVYVSAASAWEAAIKAALGRLEYPATIEAGVEASGFEKLDVSFAHAEHAAALPVHHRDPFDRMLIAQAHLEQLTLVTNDARVARYDVPLLW